MSDRRDTPQLLLVDIDEDKAATSEGFDRILELTLEAEAKVNPARTWNPSSIGHPCDRYSVWRFIRWREQSRPRPTLQSIFDQGNDIQPLIYKRLEQMGYDVIREYDRPMQYEPREGIVISGRPDGKVRGWRGRRFTPPYVLEAKSTSAWVWDSIHSVDDVLHHRSFRVRSYYAQGQLYAFLEDLPHGVLVLYSKATGLLKWIRFDLDYPYVEELLKKIERLAPMVGQRKDPPPIPYDPDICKGCDFGRSCYPARSYGEGATVLEGPVVAMLERWWDLRRAGREYKHADEELKETLKHGGISFAVAGDFIVESTQRSDGAIVYSIDKLGAGDEGAA